jgi:tRNA A-37 threonylcarbamoyl transferase component Bud32
VAGAVYPAGAFYRADLVTEVVPDSVELADAAFGGTGATSEDALRAAGLLVRQMEAARIVHADLNAHNILLLPTDPRAGAYVVDLDRARALAPGAAAPERVMRRRLERSLRKLERLRGHPLLENDWAALRAGFEGAA